MVRCPKCGQYQEDDSTFCGQCGLRLPPIQSRRTNPVSPQQTNTEQLRQRVNLEKPSRRTNHTQTRQHTNFPQQPQYTNPAQSPIPQTQKKNPALLAAVIGVLLTVLLLAGMIVFFVVKSKTEISDPAGRAAKDSLSATRESETADTEETEKKEDLQHSKDEVRTVGKTDADVNALETGYFDMNGVVDVRGQEVYLNLQNPVSVYAYNPDQEPVYLEKVSSFLVKDAGNISEYKGSGVRIKGSVSIGEDDQPILLMSKYIVTRPLEEEAAHRYVIVLKDCTWQEAFAECRSLGGYLAHIDSASEYETVISMLEEQEEYKKAHFYLGGRREEDASDYYWVDSQDGLSGSPINRDEYWAIDAWMEGEPSYFDGDVAECYMNLFYYEEAGAWVLNDVPEDVSEYYPERTGYICEMEE